jgi:hypothetical protein
MPSEDIELAAGKQVRFFYLWKWPNVCDMICLQSIRSGLMTEEHDLAKTYHRYERYYARDLAVLLKNLNFDAIVSPPSTHPDVKVYLKALRKRKILDLSGRFSRNGITKAATADFLRDLIDEFKYSASGDESKIKSLLIVDDLVASGNTIAAVLDHLEKAGLPDDCQITVAAPVWLKQDG